MTSFKARQSLGRNVTATDQIEEHIQQSSSDRKQAPRSERRVSFSIEEERKFTGRFEVSQFEQSSDNDEKSIVRKRKGLASGKFNLDDDNQSIDEEDEEINIFSHGKRKRIKTTAEVELSDNEVNKGIVRTRKRNQGSTLSVMSTQSSEKIVEVDSESSSNEEIIQEMHPSSSLKMKRRRVTTLASYKSDPGHGNKPNLLNLMTLSTSHGDINIIQKSALHYRMIGTYLLEDYDGTQVDIIEKNKKEDAEAIVLTIYQKWTAKDLNCSWSKLAECFRICGLKNLAFIIKQYLGLPLRTEIPSQFGEVMTSQVSSDEEQQSKRLPKLMKRRKSKGKTVTGTSFSTLVSANKDEDIEQSLSRKSRKKVHKKVKGEKRIRKEKRKSIEMYSSPSSTSDTESDDLSSKEHDELRNLSRAESKQFKRIYKKFYGKLCCSIKDPVKLGADFQMNGLLSTSVMRKLHTPLYSQQEKINQLIDGVYKRIKSNPGRIYSFIELLLCSIGFEEIGRQMWGKIGARFPGRTAARFGSALPPSSLTDNVTLPTVAQTSQVQNHSFVIPSVAGNSIPPMAGQCISPVLLKYRKYLQSYYNSRDLAPSDKYLPTLDTPYISLAIVTSRSSDLDERDEFTKATLHGGVDQILKLKEPIVFQDLLTSPEGSHKPVRFVLVEGPPGIGKSTFAWEVCRRWEDIPCLKAYDAIILLKLRERWVLNAKSLVELFRYPGEPEFGKHISKEFDQSQGLNLLLILDGFDEVSHNFHENSVIKHILNRVLLPECTIILTTRPSATATLEIDFQPLVNKHLEIIGFPEEERVKYFAEVFNEQPELQFNFLKYMFNIPHIRSMMYIPLNCAIVAKVCSESKHSSCMAMPRTRTQLYKGLIHSFLVRYMSLNGGGIAFSSTLPECLPLKEMGFFKTLAKFAFDSYHESKTKKITFFEEDIPNGLVHFGLMNESTEMYGGKGMERSYSFLHLSMQEYLAAWHIANSFSIQFQIAYHHVVSVSKQQDKTKRKSITYYKGESTEERALITKLKPISSTLGEPAVLLAGITGLNFESGQTNPWESYLRNRYVRPRQKLHNPSAISNYYSIALRSLYEAQNTTILASNSLCRNISIGYDPYDSYAVSYCISHCSKEVPLNIIWIYGDSSNIEAFCRGLHDHCKSNVLRVDSLSINPVKDDVKTMSWLVDTIRAFMTGVKHIFINQGVLAVELSQQSKQISVWTHALPYLKSLETVSFSAHRLCNIPPSDPMCQALENSITELELNVILPYSSYDIISPTALFINDLLTSMLRSKLIRVLFLPNISRENMANVYAIIMQCSNLVKLRLVRCRLGYDGILYICNALKYNTSLKRLFIQDHENLDRQSDDTQKEIPLPNKATCTDVILGLNYILMENCTLEKLDISITVFREWIQLLIHKPFATFDVGRIRNGTTPALRRSYSLSDITSLTTMPIHNNIVDDIMFESGDTFPYIRDSPRKREIQRMNSKMCYNKSFTAPDTDIIPSLSHLDLRLKECLGIPDSQLQKLKRKLSFGK